MNVRLIVTSMLMFLLVGCSGDPYEDYLGYWQRADTDRPQVLYIFKDGDTYLADENVFQTTDFVGRKKKPLVLSGADKQLAIENGMGRVTLGLSGDGKTLHASNRTYTRLPASAFASLQAEVAAADLKVAEDKKVCGKLGAEYTQAIQALSQSGLGYKERSAKTKEISAAFKSQAQAIDNCNLGIIW